MTILELKHDILADNKREAQVIRDALARSGTLMVNLMSSPGAGKTSTILGIAKRLRDKLSMAVIEGDIDSKVDSLKVKEVGVTAVQINTGGACHLDVPMMKPAIDLLDLDMCDLVIVENIGNLVCPADYDIGADLSVMILSVPEGDDKILKYPLMFSMCDALIVNKTDYLELPSNNFNIDRLKERMSTLNPHALIFETSAWLDSGYDKLCAYLEDAILAKKSRSTT